MEPPTTLAAPATDAVDATTRLLAAAAAPSGETDVHKDRLAPDDPLLRRWPALASSALPDRLGWLLAELRQMLGPAPTPSDWPDSRLLTRRAARRGWTDDGADGHTGATSLNGSCSFIRARDGWFVLNLARPGDVELVPAWLETGDAPRAIADARLAAADRAAGREVVALVERARLLGLPVARPGLVADAHLHSRGQARGEDGAVVPFLTRAPRLDGPAPTTAPHAAATAPPPRRDRIRRDGIRLDGMKLVELASLWAGPLCGQVLRRAGADVLRIESPRRRDGFLGGDPVMYNELNAGKRLALLDPAVPEDRRRLVDVVADADIVVSGSRPRVFDQWGVDPMRVVERGALWVSVTGHGWQGTDPNRVAFGDDAAVAGGLWVDGPTPSFVGDAIADPLSGLTAAWAALTLADGVVGKGGGAFIDLAMREAVHWLTQTSGIQIA